MKRVKNYFGKFYLVLIFVFLYAPILTLIVYSFNADKGRKWTGFTFDWYVEMVNSPSIMDALKNTLLIALISAFVATIIGIVACFGIRALKSRMKSAYMALNNVPLLNSDLVTGLSLMLLFILFGITFGYSTVLLAHITFNIPYVILCVLPQMRGNSDMYYEAALDLGAKPAKAFFKVYLPELMPGIISGFLMAFTMSLDDFIITHFTKGAGINTISTLIYSEVRVGITPALNALSTVLFLSAVLLVVLMNIAPRKKEKKK